MIFISALVAIGIQGNERADELAKTTKYMDRIQIKVYTAITAANQKHTERTIDAKHGRYPELDQSKLTICQLVSHDL